MLGKYNYDLINLVHTIFKSRVWVSEMDNLLEKTPLLQALPNIMRLFPWHDIMHNHVTKIIKAVFHENYPKSRMIFIENAEFYATLKDIVVNQRFLQKSTNSDKRYSFGYFAHYQIISAELEKLVEDKEEDDEPYFFESSKQKIC